MVGKTNLDGKQKSSSKWLENHSLKLYELLTSILFILRTKTICCKICFKNHTENQIKFKKKVNVFFETVKNIFTTGDFLMLLLYQRT